VLTGGTSVNVTPPALGAPQSGAAAGAVQAIGAMVNNSAASPAAKGGAIAQNVASLDPRIVGTFHGWIERNQSINKNLASSIQITTTSKGTYSGRLLTGATVLALRGSLIVEPTQPLQARVLCVLPKLGTLDVTLDSAGNLLSGTLTDSSSNVAAIHGWRNVWPTADGNAEAFKGMHTFYLQPRSVDNSVPQGSGFGSLIVNAKSGITFINVTLSDGAKFSSATILGPLGQTLLYGSLYTNLGSVAGHLLVVPRDNSISGNPTWLRPDLTGKVRDSSYQAGFGPVELDVAGGLYLVPKKGEFALGVASGANVSLVGANSLKGAVAAAAVNQVRVSTLSSSTGAFSGSFMVQGATAADNRRANFYGQLVTTKDGTTKGYGYFLSPKLPVLGQPVTSSPKFSGSVLLNSAP
jgi:hypothetical protein